LPSPAPAVQAAEAPSVLIEQGQVSERVIREILTVYGVIQPDPDQVVVLAVPRAGVISQVWVRLGQRTKRGQKLLALDTAPSAKMAFLQARSAVNFARQQLAQKERLVNEQLATRTQLEAAKQALRDAEARLAALRKLGQGLDQEILYAPMDGIITQIRVQLGDRIQADNTAMQIASEDQLVAVIGVEPEDLGLVHPGAPVVIAPVFMPQPQVSASVREVHAMINPATNLVDVLVPIPDGKTDRLTLGSKITAKIQLSSRKGLTVPRSAVLRDDQGAYLFRVVDGRAKRVTVTVGPGQDGYVEITGDIGPGQPIVVSGNYELTDGMAVRKNAR